MRRIHRATAVPVFIFVLVVGHEAGASFPSRVASAGVQTGAVEGSIGLGTIGEPPPPMLSPYARRRYSPPSPAASGTSPEDVVVYLSPVAPIESTSEATAVVRQENQTILPRVTVVQTGTRIDFPNNDDIFHNLFSLSPAHPFNLGRYPPGESRSERFAESGVVRMFCDIHSDMVGVILVVDTPYFAQPDANGEYRISDIPPGRYTAVAWHDAAPSDSMEVTVPESGVVRADFRLGM